VTADALPRPGRPPSVDALARQLAAAGSALPHPLLVGAAREAIALGDPQRAGELARQLEHLFLRRVINATGVLLHTNLGRAPIGTMPTSATGYANLELDLDSGERAARAPGIPLLLRELTGCDDALVVNNGAAAVLLVLSALAHGQRVIVSRGELVEIGGGFRIPEILAVSGATMVEVGTTNITRSSDYERELIDGDFVLVVHQANFAITGFTERPSVPELVRLHAPVLVDLGSGLLDARVPWLPDGPPGWLAREPAVRQTLAEGAAVVTFSGDKLLGGPQAGVIVGDGELVSRCARHPLARALRPGRLVLETMQETLLAYLARDLARLPLWRMASVPLTELRLRAQRLAARTGAEPRPCRSLPGGGSAPQGELDSYGIALPAEHAAALRMAEPPVLARVHDDMTVLDLRTVDPADDDRLAAIVAAVVK
jgi:L-seryl-tRNA(Ser) seleniumtransferase